jgi:hypothetical protein
MSPKSIALLVALGVLGTVAVALTFTPSGFDTSGDYSVYPEKADFDGAFAAIQAAFIQHPEILNPAITAADRESLRLATLKRMTLEHVGEYVSE